MSVAQELVTLTDVRLRLHELLKDIGSKELVLLRHGKPVGVMVGFDAYQSLLSRIEDLEDKLAVLEARDELPGMNVPWEKVKAETGLLGEQLEEAES
jgi:PHD/YefM family antitoxin component YafN of YafNO toxin-antitoxin module